MTQTAGKWLSRSETASIADRPWKAGVLVSPARFIPAWAGSRLIGRY